MHISEGVLSAPLLISGTILTAAGTTVGLKKMDYDRVAQVGILSAAFFVASLIHINIGPAGIHLVLNGIVGLMLGWSVFPAILVALALQAVFFQFGGITTLGINTFNMALPPLICCALARQWLWKNQTMAAMAAFACGFFSVGLSSAMVALSLIFSEKNFWETAVLIMVSNLPVMIIDGIITAFCIGFLKKVQPTLLPGCDG